MPFLSITPNSPALALCSSMILVVTAALSFQPSATKITLPPAPPMSGFLVLATPMMLRL